MSTRVDLSIGSPSPQGGGEPEGEQVPAGTRLVGWIERVGGRVLYTVQHAGHFGILLAATAGALPQIRRYWPAALVQAKRIGVDGVGLVIVVGGLSGSLLAQQTGYQLSSTLPLSLVGSGVVAGMLTELGPVLTAIVVAGRTGAGIGAELGTMKVTDQIDALVTLGRDPVVELVAPRVVGGIIAMLPLVIIANFVGILAGWLTAISLLPMTTAEYVQGAQGYYHAAALIFSLVKAPIFGFTITFVASYVGLRAEGGAAGVGRTATTAVVAIIVAIMVLDVILAPVYNAVA
jgi:phospholipid/cholesterol/gamma-HCH transport system permease protein